MGKVFSILLITILAVSSLMIVESAFAQTTPKPSVPEFTLRLVGPPYLLNTTYSLDPNTGQIVANIGYTNPYSALEINVKNQPYDSTYGNLYYNVRIKNHNATDNWVETYRANYFFPTQSNGSDYTNVGGSIEDYYFAGSLVGRQIDIQVEAMLGGIFRKSPAFSSGDEFRGETSGWSSTQTIDIPANVPITSNSSPSPSSTLPNISPTSPPDSVSADLAVNLAVVAIAILVISVVSLLLYVRHLRRSISKPDNSA